MKPKSTGSSWIWVFLCVFASSLVPEYIAPFFITIGYIIFLKEQKSKAVKIKLGILGKTEFLFFGFMLLTALWSPTKLFSAAMAGLWMWMYLIQLMLANTCNTLAKLRRAMSYFSAGAAVAGLIGIVQFAARFIALKLETKALIPDPLYQKIDTIVYGLMPFSIKDVFFPDRSSSTYSNPNIFASLLVIALPIALYLLITSKTKNGRIVHLCSTVFIFLGIASTKTRIAFIGIMVCLILFLFAFERKHRKSLFILVVVAFVVIVPFILSRFKGTFQAADDLTFEIIFETILGGKSSKTHFKIWHACFDYLKDNPLVLFFGRGAGVENTWDVLLNLYGINHPHAHNIIIETIMQCGLVGLGFFIAPAVIFLKQTVQMLKLHSKHARLLAVTFLNVFVCFNIIGITDYLFNSPKQIMILFIVAGLAQAAYKYFLESEKSACAETK